MRYSMRMAHNWIIRVHNWSHILIISSSCLQTEHAGVPLSSHDLSPPRAYYFSLKHTLPSSSPPSPQLSAQLLAPAMAPARSLGHSPTGSPTAALKTPPTNHLGARSSARRPYAHQLVADRSTPVRSDETTTKLRRNYVIMCQLSKRAQEENDSLI